MSAEPTAADNKNLAELTDEQVREYLRQHNDFFEHHPDMLDHLHISHSTGSAVSLVEKQVSVLRERNMEMRKRLNSLTTNARDNDQLYDITRALILALLEARSQDEIGAAFNKSMQDDFAVEHASLILFGDPRHATENLRIESGDSARIEIGALLRNRKPTCGVLRKEELSYLFPAAGDIGSAAVMPLSNGSELGVIAVGSSNASHYTSSMGTLFLSHIADVLIRLLPRITQEAP
jgi:uncharacterized protein YigA (DUF484 family)